MTPIFFGIIKNGKVIFDNKDKFEDYLLSLENKAIDIIVRKHCKGRSNQQNKYMWGVCYKLLSETTGHTEDEIHDSMRAMFLMDNSGKFPIVRSSTSLSTVEMEEYLEKIRQWAAQELSCIIPLPNEVDFKSAEPIISPHVSAETLKDLFGWAGKGSITKEKIMQLCSENFNGRKPRELTEQEAGQLDTIIISELNK